MDLNRKTNIGGFRLNGEWQTREQVIAAFIGSPEFQSRFGGNLTNREFVRRLYLNIPFREPDPPGRDCWTGQLDSGATTRSQVTRQFVVQSWQLPKPILILR